MAQDFGILISQPGVSVSNAKTSQIVMNTAHPFIKLDTQNPKAFQNILLLITTDPPEPAPGAATYTTVYSFPHGYTYIPSLETLFFVTSPPPSTVTYQTYFQDSGIIGQKTLADQAKLYAVADAKNVYFIIRKTSGTGTPNLLTGTTIQIGQHVFLDDIQN
jgi:hypothetical protein